MFSVTSYMYRSGAMTVREDLRIHEYAFGDRSSRLIWGSAVGSVGNTGGKTLVSSGSFLSADPGAIGDCRGLMWSICHRIIRPSSNFTTNETGPLHSLSTPGSQVELSLPKPRAKTLLPN